MPITTDAVELESWSGWGVQHYVIKFVSDLRQVSGFLKIRRWPFNTGGCLIEVTTCNCMLLLQEPHIGCIGQRCEGLSEKQQHFLQFYDSGAKHHQTNTH
jgi:hypothetical protein